MEELDRIPVSAVSAGGGRLGERGRQVAEKLKSQCRVFSLKNLFIDGQIDRR